MKIKYVEADMDIMLLDEDIRTDDLIIRSGGDPETGTGGDISIGDI